MWCHISRLRYSWDEQVIELWGLFEKSFYFIRCLHKIIKVKRNTCSVTLYPASLYSNSLLHKQFKNFHFSWRDKNSALSVFSERWNIEIARLLKLFLVTPQVESRKWLDNEADQFVAGCINSGSTQESWAPNVITFTLRAPKLFKT